MSGLDPVLGRTTAMSRGTDYDAIAARFDSRYAAVDYRRIEVTLAEFVKPGGLDVLEVGCGTGHWLQLIADRSGSRTGVDFSAGMLVRARSKAPGAGLVRARAEDLPCADRSFDRVFCINAFHHFSGKPRFMLEARRVLRSGGSLMILGMDPHAAPLAWWVYDHFPGTLALDRTRYAPSAQPRAGMQEAGFVSSSTRVAQRISEELSVEETQARGLLEKTFTSQLSMLSDGEYHEGLQRLRARSSAAATRGRRLMLRADFGLYATVGQAT